MASAVVYAAFKSAIEAAWTHTVIDWPNGQSDAPKNNAPFLSVTFPVAMEYQASTGAPGANLWRTEGGARLALSIPVGEPLDGAGANWLQRLDALRAALRGKQFGAVKTFDASPATDGGASDRGAYYVVSFAVAYQTDVIG